jgi:N4-gp56 family major capsid protein
MADTTIGTGDAQAVKRWSDQLMRETFGKMAIRGLIGRGQNACIRLLTDLDSDAGDAIKYDLRYQDRSAGVSGDDRLKEASGADGSESALVFHQAEVVVNQKRNAHVFGQMTQQRTVHDLRREARDSMSNWFSWGLEAGFLAHLAGTTGDGNESSEPFLFETTTGAATTGADVFGNTVAAIDAGHEISAPTTMFNLDMVEQAVALAKTVNPRVAPARIDGEDRYIILIHPYAARDLRSQLDGTQAGTQSWINSMRQAGMRGEANPIWTGALGEYSGALLVENEFVPFIGAASANTCHNVLLGAGAGAIAFGNAWNRMSSVRANGGGSYFSYIEDVDDYGNRTGYGVGSVTGFERCDFNSAALGVVTIVSQDAPPA